MRWVCHQAFFLARELVDDVCWTPETCRCRFWRSEAFSQAVALAAGAIRDMLDPFLDRHGGLLIVGTTTTTTPPPLEKEMKLKAVKEEEDPDGWLQAFDSDGDLYHWHRRTRRAKDEEEEAVQEDSVASVWVPGQILLMVEPLVSGSLLCGVLASSENHRNWTPLGDDFWGTYPYSLFPCSTVDTVHASVFGGFMVISHFLCGSYTSDPEVGSGHYSGSPWHLTPTCSVLVSPEEYRILDLSA